MTYMEIVKKYILVGWPNIQKFMTHPKWDKCFTLLLLGWHVNGNELKAQIEDIYTKRIHWVSAKNLELVTKRK